MAETLRVNEADVFIRKAFKTHDVVLELLLLILPGDRGFAPEMIMNPTGNVILTETLWVIIPPLLVTFTYRSKLSQPLTLSGLETLTFKTGIATSENPSSVEAHNLQNCF